MSRTEGSTRQLTDDDVADRAEELLDLSGKEFYSLVDVDIRNQSSQLDAAALRSNPVVVERWHQTLSAMKRSVEGTLAAKNAEARAARIEALQDPDRKRAQAAVLRISGEHARWRAGAIRFATGVTEKFSEAKYVRRQLHDADEDRIRFEKLRRAIADHRRRTLEDDVQPSPADLKLWESIS